MRLAADSRVERALVFEGGGVAPCLYDEPAARIEEQCALLAAQERLWCDGALNPCYACPARSAEELFGETRATAAWAGELSVERIIRLLRGRELIRVPSDCNACDCGVQRLNSPRRIDEIT